VQLARCFAADLLYLCESLVKENPASMDTSDTNVTHLLELAMPVMDFMLEILGSVAPVTSPQTAGRRMSGPDDDLQRYSMAAWGVVSFCCERIKAALQQGRVSRAALEEPLLRQGLLLKWLRGSRFLLLELGAQGLLDFSCCMLNNGGSRCMPGAAGVQPLGRQSSSHELAGKVRSAPLN
jgi:hypothetical protein